MITWTRLFRMRQPAMRRWGLAAAVALSLVIAPPGRPLAAQGQGTQLVIRNPDSVSTGPITSFVGSQPFVVEVKSPGGGPEVTVTFTTASGTTRTLTIPETGPGSGAYVSQPITADSGAQKTGAWEKHLPGNLSSDMSGLGTEDGEGVSVTVAGTSAQSSFRVYKTNITQANGEYALALARARAKNVDAKIAATKLLQRKNLKPAQIASLQNSLRVFNAKIKLIDDTSTLIANPPARTGIGDYAGTEWWKLGIYTTNWQLLNLRDPSNATYDDISNAQSMGRNIAEKARTEANNFLVKSLALGLYNAATSATMAGPFYTAITGKNIYGKEATAEEIEGAIMALGQFAVGMVVVPIAIDAVAGAAANELTGLGGRPASPPGPQPTGVQSRNLPEGNPVFMNDQRLAAARLDVASRGFQAASGGMMTPDAVVTLLTDTFDAAERAVKAGEPGKALTILNDANLQIADTIFQAEHPGARMISNPAEINLTNSVKTKAALEAQGKAQTWTKAEVGKLHEMNADPNLTKTWEYEDPSDPVHQTKAANGHDDPFDPGYKPVATAEDTSNISNAAGKALKMAEDVPAGPNGQRPVQTPQPTQPTQPAKPTPTGGQRVDLGKPINATGAGRYEILDYNIDQLKAEILDKRQHANRRAYKFSEAPVSGERVATGGKKLETDVVTGKNIDALTQEEIAKFTPDDIKKLPTGVRDKLPLNKLSARQLQAMADSGITLQNDQIKGLTPETIGRMPTELRDLLPVEALSSDQLKALAKSMGLPTAGPTTTGLGPMSGSASGGAGKKPPVDNGGIRPEDARRASAAILGDPIPEATGDGSVGMGSPTGSLSIGPGGGLALTPFVGGPTYPGLFGPNGGFQLFPPGTTLAPGTAATPTFFSGPFTLPLKGLTNGPSGTVTYGGFTVGGLGGPGGLDPGGLNLTPWPPKTQGPKDPSSTGGGDPSGGNVVGGFFPPPPNPPLGPLFGFSDYDLFDPEHHLTVPFITETTPAVDELPGFVAGHFMPLDALSFDHGPADAGVQIFITIVQVDDVPDWDIGAPSANWLSPARWWQALSAVFDVRPDRRASRSAAGSIPRPQAVGASPGNRDVGPQAGRSGQGKGLKTVFVSLGTATGEAFDAQILNETGGPVSLNGDGVVLESIGKGAQDKVRKQVQDEVKAHHGKAPATARISGYCLEYLKPPPAAGGLFRVAGPEMQAKYAGLRKVLQAEEELERLGGFAPDIDPKEYFHQLRQWALWSKAQGFTPETFAKEFIDHAKKNVTAAKQPWTKQIESQIAGLVPHRWQAITTVLQAAASRGGS